MKEVGELLFHVSNVSGIRILEPRVSTHGKAYVYAVRNLVTGLVFGARHDDFDFDISTNEDGKATISECYPNAFEKVFKGKGCSVYLLNDDGFCEGKTGWDVELVCEHAVEVMEEKQILDLYQRLLQEQEEGNVEIHFYEDTIEYKRFVSSHIVDRLIRFHLLDSEDERMQTYYGRLIAAVKETIDGHLL